MIDDWRGKWKNASGHTSTLFPFGFVQVHTPTPPPQPLAPLSLSPITAGSLWLRQLILLHSRIPSHPLGPDSRLWVCSQPSSPCCLYGSGHGPGRPHLSLWLHPSSRQARRGSQTGSGRESHRIWRLRRLFHWTSCNHCHYQVFFNPHLLIRLRHPLLPHLSVSSQY